MRRTGFVPTKLFKPLKLSLEIQSVTKEGKTIYRDETSYMIFHRALYDNTKYDCLNKTDHLVFMNLFDMMKVSRKNGWVDENDFIYVLFPINQMAEKLRASENTISDSYKRLESVGLICRHKKDSSRLNQCYILYVSRPEERSDIPETDVPEKFSDVPEKFSDVPEKPGLSNNNKSNNNKSNNSSNTNVLEGAKAQPNTLFPICIEKSKAVSKSKGNKPNGNRDLALWKVNEAREGRLAWSELSYRDFTYYYIAVHNKKMPKPIVYDKYTSVTILRERLLKSYEISNEKACEYIQAIIDDYSTHPNRWDSLTFNMIDKQTKLMNEIVSRVKRKLEPVELTYNWNDLGEIKDDGTRVF